MKSVFLYVLLLVIPIVSSAQQEVLEVRGGTIEIGILVDGLKNSKYTGVDGSPYLNSEFIPAKINEIKKTQFIRFNIVDQIVEVKIKANEIVMLDLKNDFKIQLLDGTNRKYCTAIYIIDGKKVKSFFEVIHEGENYDLFKQERKKLLNAQKAEGYQDKLPARFIDLEDTFYVSDFKSKSSNLIELPKKRRKLIAFFDEKEKLVDKFMKREKLNFKEKDGLTQMLDFVFAKD